MNFVPDRVTKCATPQTDHLLFTMPIDNKRAAIFLDRDGTLNFDHGWICSPDLIELLPGAADAVRAINESGYLAVLATNQPVIGRGECSETKMLDIHRRLAELLLAGDARLDAIYYCPHRPEDACACRKPAPGMLIQAARELNINISKSWMIGDSERDIGAAAAFGISAALVSSNQRGFKDVIADQPTLRAASVAEAVRQILKLRPSTDYYQVPT